MGSLHIWKGTINAERYIQVLEQHMLPIQTSSLSRGRPIIGADIKHFTDIGHFKNRFADNFFFFMQTNILFTGDYLLVNE